MKGTKDIYRKNITGNVFLVKQMSLDDIPLSPWVYALSNNFVEVIKSGHLFENIGQVKLGLSSVDMLRFYRCEWEVDEGSRWHRMEKGGSSYLKWYGLHEWKVNWFDDGQEMIQEIIHRYPYLKGNYGLKIRGDECFGDIGLTYSRKSGNNFSARLLIEGNLFEDNGPAIFFNEIDDLTGLAILNSSFINYINNLINPGIDCQKGDVEKFPFPKEFDENKISNFVKFPCYISILKEMFRERAIDFVVPPKWRNGNKRLMGLEHSLEQHETKIDEHIYGLYGITNDDKDVIEYELRENFSGDKKQHPDIHSGELDLDFRWISYSVGIILGRFQPGSPEALGSAVYRKDDFVVGSLKAPDEEEFNELVGPPDQFAYVDEEGGRHVFSRETEEALRDPAVEDGITVFDESHPQDLPTLVEEALILMLGTEDAREVINEGAGGDLRTFLKKKYFTDWHVKWYSASLRKAPIYWPLQPAELSYGFLIFHEKFQKDTLYVLQRDYLDYKINGLEQRISDLATREEVLEGSARKEVSRQLEELRRELEEITDFSQKIERIAEEGYQPEPDWIDDGVILRMAPLWELIPIWQEKPKDYWEELQAGEYDWSHIAMNYWPKRVKEKCKENKSYAIAHGHEEWYQDE